MVDNKLGTLALDKILSGVFSSQKDNIYSFVFKYIWASTFVKEFLKKKLILKKDDKIACRISKQAKS